MLLTLILVLIACNPSKENNGKTNTVEEEKLESEAKKQLVAEEIKIDIKALFQLSPLSIFDDTTEGLSLSEKNDLLEKGESDTWKIIEESETKLIIRCKYPSSEVTFRFLHKKDSLDGLLFATVVNERNSKLHSWNYTHEDNSLQAAEVLNKYTANDFVSKEDKFPDSYSSVMYYVFIDDHTIEVSPHTWMDEEFENREIINKIYLKWNGEEFEEEIVNNK